MPTARSITAATITAASNASGHEPTTYSFRHPRRPRSQRTLSTGRGRRTPGYARLHRRRAPDQQGRHARCLRRGARFPDYFGRNWDALEECLHDATLPAGLCIDRAGIPESADPESWEILLDILAASAEDWQVVEQPFSIFLRGGHAAYPLIVA
ncbi:MAG: barstar family protein [Hydrogenophilales bacterium]|nr:barstar family protein [Hydrogenophilales bacterium]